MACSITIIEVKGSSPGPTVTVNGLAQECEQVRVSLFCATGGQQVQTVPVVAGKWEAIFPNAGQIACACGSGFGVIAECLDTDGTACARDKIDGVLNCEGEECPSIAFTFEHGDCTNGTTPFTIQATLNAAGGYSAQLSDSVTGILDTVSGSGTLILTHTGNYSGSVTFTVTILSPSNCPGDSFSIGFPSCPECPNVSWSSSVGDCVGDQRSVTVTAELSSADAYTARLKDANDPVPDLDSVSGAGTLTMTHTGNYPAGSTQKFKVLIDSPDVCNESELTVMLAGCGGDGGDGGDDDDGEGFGCFGVRAIMTISAILAAVSVSLAACIPAAATPLLILAGALGLVALIAGIVWGIFCSKPCGWGLLLTWQVAIGAGLILLCFTTCCPVFWWIGLGLVILVGLPALYIWKRRCRKSNCAVAKELTLALSGAVLPLLGWLGVIPVLTACINPVATGFISTLAAAVAVSATQCSD